MKKFQRTRRFVLLLLTAVALLSTAYAEEETQYTTAAGTREDPVRAGDRYVLETELLADGTPRKDLSQSAYVTATLDFTLTNSYLPDYFADKYSNMFKLTGTEAGAPLQVELIQTSDGNGIVLQKAVRVTLETATGEEIVGYQLMDAEIGGGYGVPIQPGERVYACKRYDYDAENEAKYLIVTYHQGGEEKKVYFLLEAVYDSVARADRGERVSEIQQALTDLGYLNDTVDGIFGGKTEAAVQAAQAAAGLEQTGVADNAFQHALFEGAVPECVQEELQAG